MRTAARIALGALALVAPLAGCGGGGGSRQVCPGPAGNVQWVITDTQGIQQSCDAAGASAVVVTVGGAQQTFPCGPGGGETSLLPSGGVYTVSAQLVAANGAVIAQTSPVSVSVDSCNVTPFPTFSFSLPAVCPTGTPALQVSWDIVRNSTNAPLTCEQAGAFTVDITVGSMVASFPCSDYGAVTETVPPGTFDVNMDLFDGNGNAISTFGPLSVNFASCRISDIGNVTFPIN
jgi:hypothetical protein